MSMGVYWYLWMFEGIIECLWVFMGVYRCVWVPIVVYGFIWVSGCLWVLYLNIQNNAYFLIQEPQTI